MVLSVVISIFNEPIKWIKESIDSILNQTFQDFELIIVNDNPSRQENDELLELLKNKDSRIVILKNEENIGLTRSLNKAIGITKGSFIARMDADDIAYPNRFQEQLQFLQSNQDYLVVGSYVKFFGGFNKVGKHYPFKFEEVEPFMLQGNPIPHPTAMLRRKVFFELNIRYDENLKVAQDYQLWSDIVEFGKIKCIPKILLKYRVSENQISSSKKLLQDKVAYGIREKIFENLKEKVGGSNFSISYVDENCIDDLFDFCNCIKNFHSSGMSIAIKNSWISNLVYGTLISIPRFSLGSKFKVLFSSSYVFSKNSFTKKIKILIKVLFNWQFDQIFNSNY